MIGDYVRDKDAILSSCMIAEITAWAADQGMSLFELMLKIYTEYGFYKEKLVNVVRKGLSGQAEIKSMMENYRSNPPKSIVGNKVVKVKDYLLLKTTNLVSGETEPIHLPKSDVLQFFLEDGSRISVRPSGTEPKIKYYFGVKGQLASISEFPTADKALEERVEQIITEMGLR
jgi:phosphoglucomutase